MVGATSLASGRWLDQRQNSNAAKSDRQFPIIGLAEVGWTAGIGVLKRNQKPVFVLLRGGAAERRHLIELNVAGKHPHVIDTNC
jgi:hypothetical protein